jgi:hypothetical protein
MTSEMGPWIPLSYSSSSSNDSLTEIELMLNDLQLTLPAKPSLMHINHSDQDELELGNFQLEWADFHEPPDHKTYMRKTGSLPLCMTRPF